MAIEYSGTGQYHSASTAAVTAAPLTMSCWCLPDTLTVNYCAMGLGRSGTPSHYHTLTAYGGLAGDPSWYEVAGAASTSAPTPYSISTWNHFAGVANGATSRYGWLNGVRSSHSTDSRSVTLTTTDLGMVYNNSPVGPLDGKLCEVAIWNAALSDDEVLALWKGFSPLRIRPQSLRFYAPMVRAVSDIRGNLTLTQTGSPTVAAHPRIYR